MKQRNSQWLELHWSNGYIKIKIDSRSKLELFGIVLTSAVNDMREGLSHDR